MRQLDMRVGCRPRPDQHEKARQSVATTTNWENCSFQGRRRVANHRQRRIRPGMGDAYRKRPVDTTCRDTSPGAFDKTGTGKPVCWTYARKNRIYVSRKCHSEVFLESGIPRLNRCRNTSSRFCSRIATMAAVSEQLSSVCQAAIDLNDVSRFDQFGKATRVVGFSQRESQLCSAYMNRRIVKAILSDAGLRRAAFGPAILPSLRGSPAVLSTPPQAEPGNLTRRRQTTVSVQSTRTRRTLRRCTTTYIRT